MLLARHGFAYADAPVAPTAAPQATTEAITVTASAAAAGKGPRLDPSLGTISYTLDQQAIDSVPGGANSPFTSALLRLPGVVQDSYGEIHIRGEHGNAQYRIDGIMLPDDLEGFGQQFDTSVVKSATLLTGTLPANYGLRLAGVVDITTKSGADLQGGKISIYGGSNGTVRPVATLGGERNDFTYFGSFSYTRNQLGIENPTDSAEALHDRTTQYNAFVDVSHPLAAGKITLLGGASVQQFQIPDIAGQKQLFSVDTSADIPSSALDENQNEQRYFGVLAYTYDGERFTLHPSLFFSENRILFTPDEVGDLLYQGVAARTLNRLYSGGGQIDASYRLDRHAISLGGRASLNGYERNDSTRVFQTDDAGTQISTSPETIEDSDRKRGRTLSAYLQDQWSLTPVLTMNAGLRYDNDNGWSRSEQLSPRISLVWAPTRTASFHVGYARLFTPPGLQFITGNVVALFRDTTNAASAPRQDVPYAERANLFDIGSLQRFGHVTTTIDAFWKQSRGGIDFGQFGDAVVLAPFNYDRGHTYGVETSISYENGPWNIGASFSYVKARAIGITSNQTSFPSDELAFIDTHAITLDHDQPFTVSLNGSYMVRQIQTKLIGDMLLGSGLRGGFANEDTLDPHYIFNAAVERVVAIPGRTGDRLRFRFDIANIFDQKAELREGSGVGIAAPQYLPRRSFFGTASFEFR